MGALISRRSALLSGVAALLPASQAGAVLCNCTTGSGPGPAATSNFVQANLNTLAGRTVYPQLFGVATGGMENTNFSVCSNTTFQTLVKALNLPLMRLHSQWGGTDPTVLANFVNNSTSIVSSSCTMIVGISLGVTQAQAKAVSDYWVAHSAIAANYWEGGNENGLSPTAYQAQFAPISAGVRQTNPGFRPGGPAYAGTPGGSYFNQLIGLNTANSLGFLSYHDYLYCSGVDTRPSNAQACRAVMANGTDRFAVNIADASSGCAGTYAAGYPIVVDEYNIECSADGDLRAGTSIGAAFMVSSLLKMAASSANPVWGGIWDLYNDSGAAYQLIDTSFNLYPQYYTLQQLIATMPGTMTTTVVGTGGVLAWATVSGSNFGVAIVNSNASPVSGPVALSNWPVNNTGNGTANIWTYPTTNLTTPTPNTPGTASTVTVTAGVTGTVTVPGNSVAIVTSNALAGGGGGGGTTGGNGNAFTDSFASFNSNLWGHATFDDGGDAFFSNDPTIIPITTVYSGGHLNQKLINTPPGFSWPAGQTHKPFLAGIQDTFNAPNNFQQQYGFWEITATVDKLPGLGWFCFTISSASFPPNFAMPNIWTDNTNTMQLAMFPSSGNGSDAPTNLPTFFISEGTNGWSGQNVHAYGMRWAPPPGNITFYIDRVAVLTLPTPTFGVYQDGAHPCYTKIHTQTNFYPDLLDVTNTGALPAGSHVFKFDVWTLANSPV